MTTITHDQEFDRLFEFSKVIEDWQSSRRSIKKYSGLVGLSLSLPFQLIGAGLIIRKNYKKLDTILESLIAHFNEADERGKMKLEARFIKVNKALELKLVPIISILKKTKFPFCKFFLESIMGYLNRVNHTASVMTSIVYPERQDPALNQDSFDRLKKVYKNSDLSDWKNEKNSIYDSLYTNNACV